MTGRLKVYSSYRGGGRLLFKPRLSLDISSAFMTRSLEVCNGYTDGGRFLFKIGLSPWRRAHSSQNGAIVTRMEGGSFSKLGSRLGAAHIRLKILQQLQRWRADLFQNRALALAPRTFVLKVCNSSRTEGDSVSQRGSRLRLPLLL